MTRDEIVAKWAGMSARERDAWVAEVVFGWRDVINDGYLTWGIPPEAPHSVRTVPRYTTDISAAWAVQELFFAVRIEGLGNSGYECEIYNGYGLSVTIIRSGEYTASEAICLAALIASLQSDERETKLTEVFADVAV